MSTSRQIWQRAKRSHRYPYLKNKPRINYWAHPREEPRQYVKRASFTHNDPIHPKDRELETVMIAIHEYFAANPSESDGATKANVCTYVVDNCQNMSISKFRFALGNAIRLRLVNQIFAENEIPKQRRRRSSATAKIVISDEDDVGVPDRMQLRHSMVEEFEMNKMSQNGKEFAIKNLKCFYCDKLFYNERGLKQHCMQSHYKAFGYAYKCDECVHHFKTEKELNHHKESLHD